MILSELLTNIICICSLKSNLNSYCWLICVLWCSYFGSDCTVSFFLFSFVVLLVCFPPKLNGSVFIATNPITNNQSFAILFEFIILYFFIKLNQIKFLFLFTTLKNVFRFNDSLSNTLINRHQVLYTMSSLNQ